MAAVDVTFQTLQARGALKPGAGLGVAPSIGTMMRACGLLETLTPATDVIYTPRTGGIEAMTTAFNLDGQQHKMIGTMGSPEFGFQAGEMPYFSANLTGFYADPSAVVLPVIANGPSAANVSVFGADVPINAFSVSLNNQVSARNLPGRQSVSITDRTPTGSITIEAPTLAEKNYFSQLRNGARGSIDWDIGTVSGQIVQFRATNTVQLLDVQNSEIDGVVFYTLPFRLAATAAGDDEFTLTLL